MNCIYIVPLLVILLILITRNTVVQIFNIISFQHQTTAFWKASTFVNHIKGKNLTRTVHRIINIRLNL